MKKLIIATVVACTAIFSTAPVLAGATVSNSFGCSSANTVFFAPTKDHKQSLELCRLNGNRYGLTYGPISRPSLRLVQPAENVAYSVARKGGFSFRQGTTIYEVAVNGKNEAVMWIQPKYGRTKEVKLDMRYGNAKNNTARFLR